VHVFHIIVRASEVNITNSTCTYVLCMSHKSAIERRMCERTQTLQIIDTPFWKYVHHVRNYRHLLTIATNMTAAVC